MVLAGKPTNQILTCKMLDECHAAGPSCKSAAERLATDECLTARDRYDMDLLIVYHCTGTVPILD